MNVSVFYPRRICGELLESLQDSPAVVIHGPRQCGKTTLAQTLCAPEYLGPQAADRRHGRAVLAQTLCAPEYLGRSGWPDIGPSAGLGYAYITFDDDAARNAARADPAGFVAELPHRVVLDEVQRVPEVFTSIKLAIDRDRRPGRFVLTGSTNVLLVPALADSLAGRTQIVRLHPLSQVELAHPDRVGEQAPPGPGFIDSLFDDGFSVVSSERLGSRLRERIAAGGYPAALSRPLGRRRTRWYADYLDAVVQRDARELARIARLDALPRLLEVAAAHTAQLFNVSRLAAPFQVSLPTIRDYLTLLERLFLLERLQPWHSNRLKRLVKTPKLHLGDTGLACALVGASPETLRTDRALLGQFTETFVYQELRRQSGWHHSPVRFYHYRDKDGAEVGIVIETAAGLVAGVEVKAGSTVISADFRGLRRLASAAGERFAAGVVLYDGEISAGFGDRLRAVPIRRLWEPPPKPAT